MDLWREQGAWFSIGLSSKTFSRKNVITRTAKNRWFIKCRLFSILRDSVAAIIVVMYSIKVLSVGLWVTAERLANTFRSRSKPFGHLNNGPRRVSNVLRGPVGSLLRDRVAVNLQG